ncbi:STAS domain-containing protein [Paenibacillus sp. PL2-23]|uniref:STAS domain-containing protein n=1 Tax=Paenibacillus sp. PL2-23 TaxID=2100729 RepID=UPI0030FC7B5D
MINELTIKERPFGRGIVFDLQGDLTKQSESVLLGCRDWAAGMGDGQAAVLNLSSVSIINSAGIALLIRLSQMALKADYRLYAYGVSPHYQKMFRLIGLTDYIMIYPDEYSLMQRLES